MKYKIISVDPIARTMIIECVGEGTILNYNIPLRHLPLVGQDSFLTLMDQAITEECQ